MSASLAVEVGGAVVVMAVEGVAIVGVPTVGVPSVVVAGTGVAVVGEAVEGGAASVGEVEGVAAAVGVAVDSGVVGNKSGCNVSLSSTVEIMPGLRNGVHIIAFKKVYSFAFKIHLSF